MVMMFIDYRLFNGITMWLHSEHLVLVQGNSTQSTALSTDLGLYINKLSLLNLQLALSI